MPSAGKEEEAGRMARPTDLGQKEVRASGAPDLHFEGSVVKRDTGCRIHRQLGGFLSLLAFC
jgi:hypothetical protein